MRPHPPFKIDAVTQAARGAADLPPDDWSTDPLVKLVSKHAGPALAVAAFAFASWIVLGAAQFNVYLALAILSASGPGAIVSGIALVWLPILAPVLRAPFIYWLLERPPEKRGLFSLFVLIFVAMFALAVSPVFSWIVAAALVLVL